MALQETLLGRGHLDTPTSMSDLVLVLPED